MKKILLILAIATVGFTSCKKDEPLQPTPNPIETPIENVEETVRVVITVVEDDVVNDGYLRFFFSVNQSNILLEYNNYDYDPLYPPLTINYNGETILDTTLVFDGMSSIAFSGWPHYVGPNPNVELIQSTDVLNYTFYYNDVIVLDTNITGAGGEEVIL